ncbi:hypothetical protein PHK61_04880 [Actinomycetospora lutea]|uniref:hypothetical protein n=1 Tax=Actinomycetospora lutea TaxID=663604 RepID=UPI002365FB90|nr:hypothetical protein [Actinomycetospora lutea]MDD7937754.1 hypothetical protein [Actinomycetospora lutea]
MTTTLAAPTAATTRLVRRAALIVTPLGPLAVAGLRWLLPYDTTDDPATLVARVAASPGAGTAVLWLSLLALLTLPLGVLVVGAVAARARPVLGTVAAVVAWIGFANLAFLVPADLMARAGVAAGLPEGSTAALVAAVAADPVSSLATTLFVLGHVLGTVLLGVALWRVVPRGVAVALIVSQPLHVVAAVVVPNHTLDGLAWLLTAVGFAAATAVWADRRLPQPAR